MPKRTAAPPLNSGVDMARSCQVAERALRAFARRVPPDDSISNAAQVVCCDG